MEVFADPDAVKTSLANVTLAAVQKTSEKAVIMAKLLENFT